MTSKTVAISFGNKIFSKIVGLRNRIAEHRDGVQNIRVFQLPCRIKLDINCFIDGALFTLLRHDRVFTTAVELLEHLRYQKRREMRRPKCCLYVFNMLPLSIGHASSFSISDFKKGVRDYIISRNV